MPLLEKWTPLRELDVMDRRMRRFFQELGAVPAVEPAADVYETDRELVVELDVPGFDEHDLAIEVSDHTLRVTGARKEQLEKKEGVVRLRERLEKEFDRRFQLPANIDGDQIRAAYTKGVLTVHVPKTSAEKPQKVEITTA